MSGRGTGFGRKSESDLFVGPNFNRWGFFGVWEEQGALDRFIEASAVVERWDARASEMWHVWLKPRRIRGTWRGIDPLEGLEREKGVPDAPAVVLTRFGIPLRKVPAFWLSAVVPPTTAVFDAPGLLAATGVIERPYLEAITFTVWSSSDAAMSFAYNTDVHKRAIERTHAEGLAEKGELFAWFYPYRSQGTWDGRDPVAEASSTP